MIRLLASPKRLIMMTILASSFGMYAIFRLWLGPGPEPPSWERFVANLFPVCNLRKPSLVIVVSSLPEHHNRRDAIRSTWGTWSRPNDVLVTFLLGRPKTEELAELIAVEFKRWHDLVVGDYDDTYRNLTLKVLNGLSWSWQHCRSPYLLKTDDDCFVNVPVLAQFLQTFNTKTSELYVGSLFPGSVIYRDPESPFFVDTDELDGVTFPTYASGFGYLLTSDVVRRLILMSHEVKPFANEDAYVGTLISKIGITPTNSYRFVYTRNADELQVCQLKHLMVAHRVENLVQQTLLFNKSVQADSNKTCPWKDELRSWN